MILFRCCTFGQLINAIHIKMSLLADKPADLVLNQSTDFSKIIDQLRSVQIFDNIIVSPDSIEDNRKFSVMRMEERRMWSRNPKKYLYDVEFPNKYTDYFVAELNVYTQLLYYYLVANGMALTIHYYEEGMSQYVLDPEKKIKRSGIDHEYYGEKSFWNRLGDMFLFEPELYVASKPFCPIKTIPKIDYKDEQVVNLYTKIFQEDFLPSEKYIFLEEPFVWDMIDSTDIDVLDMVSEIVGKENIIVKLHPRNHIDRFAARGYKTFSNSYIPWEVLMLTTDLRKKVMLTISSNASISGAISLGRKMYAIHLANIMSVGKNMAATQPAYEEYYKKLQEVINREEMQLFTPNDREELEEVLKYISGKMKCLEGCRI